MASANAAAFGIDAEAVAAEFRRRGIPVNAETMTLAQTMSFDQIQAKASKRNVWILVAVVLAALLIWFFFIRGR